MLVELDLESLVRLVASVDPTDTPVGSSETWYRYLCRYKQRVPTRASDYVWDLEALRKCEPQILWGLYQALRPDVLQEPNGDKP